MITYFVVRSGDTIKYSGVDMGGAIGKVIAENNNILVVKWPAGSHWAGRGMGQSYHSPETHVLTKPVVPGGRHTLLISWENKRKA